jgi:S-adenosylmethionine:tRNA-ribosyltransferase-isomerase (queuine synthetase)
LAEVFYDYELPTHLIAQEPYPQRDRSRLLLLRRKDRTLAHHSFTELAALLNPGDLLTLVNAFAGVEMTRQAYMTAIAEQYRFYSYGDAMLIL